MMSSRTPTEDDLDLTEDLTNMVNPDIDAPAVTGGGVAQGVTDDMSFAEAFAAARAEQGPGGVFHWHGGTYGTYMQDEWAAMSAEQRDEFAHNAASQTASHTSDTPNGVDNTANDLAVNEKPQKEEEKPVDEDVKPTESSEQTAQEQGQIDLNADVKFTSLEQVDLAGDGTMSNVGTVSVGDQEALLIDVDGKDDTFDLMAIDLNGDGKLDEDEIIDITSEKISVSGFEMALNGGNDSPTFNNDNDIILDIDYNSDEDLAIDMTDDTTYTDDIDATL